MAPEGAEYIGYDPFTGEIANDVEISVIGLSFIDADIIVRTREMFVLSSGDLQQDAELLTQQPAQGQAVTQTNIERITLGGTGSTEIFSLVKLPDDTLVMLLINVVAEARHTNEAMRLVNDILDSAQASGVTLETAPRTISVAGLSVDVAEGFFHNIEISEDYELADIIKLVPYGESRPQLGIMGEAYPSILFGLPQPTDIRETSILGQDSEWFIYGPPGATVITDGDTQKFAVVDLTEELGHSWFITIFVNPINESGWEEIEEMVASLRMQ